jgi:hypothetical protein
MTIFAIGDLHLSGSGQKPMDVFGKHWENHFEHITARWRDMVTPEDTVLIPGDISWAMQFEEAKIDLLRIAALPGAKVLLRGNHDYWWSSISRLRAFLPAGMYALQNDSLALPGLTLCGTRGWDFPTEGFPLDAQEDKIYRRELIRLEMALQSAAKHGLPILAMTHYPPLLTDHRDTAFTALLEKYGVAMCVYGHLHSAGIPNGYNGTHCGVVYRLVSCDALGFTPVRVWENTTVPA